MDLEELLLPLRLDLLTDAWVKEIWEQEFMDDISLPTEYETFAKEESDYYDRFNNLIDCLKCFVSSTTVDNDNDDSDSNVNSWKNLIGVINHEKLVALLFSIINKGDNDVTVNESRLQAVCAARLYMVMLAIPGSKAFRIFHCQMFVVCLKVLRFGEKLLDYESNFNDGNICSYINKLNMYLINVLEDFLLLIEKFDLKTDSVCVEESINVLVDISNNVPMNSRQYINKDLLGTISEYSFKCIHKFIKDSSNVPDKKVIDIVFKYLLPKFIFTEKTPKKIMMSYQVGGIVHCSMFLRDYGDIAVRGFTCLIQHLCFNTMGLERAENRSFRVMTIYRLLCLLPLESYTDQLHWIVKLSRNSLPARRSLSLDVIGLIITGKDEISGVNENSDENFLSNDILNQSNSENDADEMDSQNTLEKYGDVGHKDLLKVVVERCQDVSPTVRTKALAILVSSTSAEKQSLHALIKEVFNNGEVLLNIAEEKSKDERVYVRVVTIKLIDNLLKIRGELLTKNNLQLVVDRCRDTSIQVRTAAINTLTNLAQVWGSATIAEAWIDGALNQLSDTETKVQDLILGALHNLLFANLVEYNLGAGRGKDRFPWILLNAIIRKNMRRHLKRACIMLLKAKPDESTLNSRLIDLLITHLKTENNLSCWVLLSCIARFIQVDDITFVIDYFHELTGDSLLEDIKLLVLVQEVLCEWCMCLSDEQSSNLREQILQNLQYDIIQSGATRGAVSLAMRLTRDDDYSWASSLLEEYDSKILSHTNANGFLDDIGGSMITTFGYIALASETKPSDDIVSLLISTIRSFNDENSKLSVSTLASIVTVLGKLSLRDMSIAVKTTKLCTKLLTSNTCPLPLKINSMCALADISTRYATMVEPMLAGMNSCLMCANLTIRRMAVQLLTQLLVSDFLKLKGVIFFHYLTLLCDEDERIRDTATYFVFRSLIIKDKNILYNNFIKTVFYFNNFNHPMCHEKHDVTEEERAYFSMEGNEKRTNRNTIYDMMLSNMSDAQLLNIQVKLCQQVLSAAEVETVNSDVLRDSLDVLRKLSRYKQAKEQNNDIVTRVTSNIVAQKMKLNDIEKVVPMVMRLYRQLKSMNSPLVSSVLGYASDLLKNYKQEVEDVMDQDIDLLNEIRKFQTNPDSFDEPEARTTESNSQNSTSGTSRANTSSKKNTLPTTPRRKSIKVRRNLIDSNIDDNQENSS